ncbi:MAG: RNA polymerase subunit sigma [Planctomycetes bacterium RBG_13_63_9]|nr:MAG: RNA polymerase subunit sigma [Planctomycetes bacterium RBG_13_63_9]
MNRPGATRRAAENDAPQAAAQLAETFSRHQDELLGTLYYLVGNIEDARDVLQETFIKCWRHRQDVPQIEDLTAWVFRVAMNAGRDMRSSAWRRRRKPLLDGVSTVVANDQGPEADAIRREELALVRGALRQLRSEEQEVFLLRQNGQMTYDQIAASISIPVGTVKTRMRLALTKLREALEAKP